MRVSLFPTAGEASVAVVPWWLEGKPPIRSRDKPPVEAPRESNARRAAQAVRRYIRANGLRYMWTLTYAVAAEDRAEVRAELERFYARLQAKYGRMPVVAVVERGRRGTRRLHVHLAVDRWLPHETLTEIWGHGFVWVGDPGKLPGEVGTRKLAGYLSKYIVKQFQSETQVAGDERPSGRHRYSVTRGWAPECKRRRFSTQAEAASWLAYTYGGPERVYDWALPTMPGIHGWALVYDDDTIAAWLAPP